MKKHIKQMNRSEIHALVNRIKRINDCRITFTNHAKKKMEERSIEKLDVVKVLNNFKIIEFDFENGVRVLLSDKNKNKLNTIITLDLCSGKILTTYKTKLKEQEVKQDKYSGKIDIVSCLNYYRIDRKIRKMKRF